MAASPAIQICGLQRREDAQLASDLGADYLGVILSQGYGRSMASHHAAQVLDGLPGKKVAVLVDEDFESAIRLVSSIQADVVQLHGSEPREFAEHLRDGTGLPVWKAVRARSLGAVEEAVDTFAEAVSGILVEGWKEGVVGGGGAAVSLEPESVRRAIPPECRFILAGGLTPGAVADAAARFLPDVVDVSSGVETRPGSKDHDLLRRFIHALRPERTSTEHPSS